MASTARPTAPPTCAVVFTSPEARPASCAVAPDIASAMSAGKARPAPAPSRTITGSTCSTYSPWTGARVNMSSAAMTRTSPGRSVARAPKRPIRPAQARGESAPMMIVVGRNAAPVWSAS